VEGRHCGGQRRAEQPREAENLWACSQWSSRLHSDEDAKACMEEDSNICLKQLCSTYKALQREIGSYSHESSAQIVKAQEWEFHAESKAVERDKSDLRAPKADVRGYAR